MSIDDGSLREELLVARAYLSAVAEPPAPALVRFIGRHGVQRAAELVRAGDVPDAVTEEVEARREHVCGERILGRARENGIRLLVPEQREWPHERFSCLSDATEIGIAGMAEPIALWVRGPASLRAVTEKSVATVGARAASGYGETLAAEFGYGLCGAGFTVVSGAAYGIDGAAHRGALAAGDSTVAYLACGVDMDYPAGHSRLLRTIAERGLVVSEYVPGTSPRRHRFLVRNRLIAASGQGAVVVEAGARSGAGNTANTADALGRPVMAVPGPVTSASSVGCHMMIRSGKAVLVTGPEEVIEVIGPMGTSPVDDGAGQPRRGDGLDRDAKQLHDALAGSDGASAEQLARDSGLPLRKVRSLLPALEMAGLAVLGENGWVRRA
ncbi:DNA processing protein [Halopolyspora algeriensis]|uniref:DNA processing protein n=1 Tax=Halopolyspora algeriensis TaxID=1500506 RepID=A0A368VF65_9ACTN|nr:DNA-processing protein DprA [Halopolyspora algeriensis]RCW39839.1 DNA processing protein [Halopolyspora algeriensis]TQM56494.1 DNA processing protein [Halopolyspora algeriensis]